MNLSQHISIMLQGQCIVSLIYNYYFPLSPQKSTIQMLKNTPRMFPILTWLRTYPVRKWLPGDITAGLSVAMLQMPQNMAYAIMASVPVSCGIYASLLPTLVYCVMGSSRHAAYGMVVFSSLTIGSIVQQETEHLHNTTSNHNLVPLSEANRTESLIGSNNMLHLINPEIPQESLEARQIALGTSATCMTAIILLVMYILRFGFIAAFMSEAFIGGFLVAGNVHVIARQLKLMLGIQIRSFNGIFNVVYLITEICKTLPQTNLMTVLISSIVFVTVLPMKICINDRFKKKLPIPVPIELITLIMVIVIAYFADINRKYDVLIVGHIPQGLPSITLPTELPTMLGYMEQCVSMALSSYILLMLTAKLFAQRNHYKLDNQQELLSAGMCNMVGSITSAVGIGISPARMFLMDACGGNTQISYLIAGVVTLLTVLCIAPVLTYLPVCVLGTLVVTSCIPIFERAKLLLVYWKNNWYDFSMFVITFLACIIIDIERGMLIGIGYSAFTIALRTMWASGTILNYVGVSDHNHGYYVPSQQYNSSVDVPGVIIYQILTPICFLTYESVFTHIENIVEKELHPNHHFNTTSHDKYKQLSAIAPTEQKDGNTQDDPCVILDMSTVNYIDTQGCQALANCIRHHRENNCTILVANCIHNMHTQLSNDEELWQIIEKVMYPSICDAIHDRRNKQLIC